MALGLVALAVRAVVFLLSFEMPGDGPMRAAIAYDWSLAPRLDLYGIWLPGFTYLTGAFAWLVPHPVVSVRILNLLLGALTVPLFYQLLRRIYGDWPALFSAAILILLPLHVGLSVSSLTEASFLFLVIAGMLLLIEGSVEQHHRRLFLASAVLLLILAQMTRYEAWVLLPAFPLYYLLATRRLLPAVCIAVALSAFPLAWTLSNYLHTGQALFGVSAAVWGTEAGPVPVTLLRAIYVLAVGVVVQIGWLLPILALAGLALQLGRWLRHQFRLEALFHATVFGLYGLTILVFTMARGASIWERYLLFGLVIGLPYAALPLEHVAKSRGRALAAVVAVITLSALLAPSVVLAPRIAPPHIYLTRQPPREIVELARWLQNSRYRSSSILLTKMDWTSTYLFLHAPEFYSRSFLFSFEWSDSQLDEFVRQRKPALLITSQGDDRYQRHIEPFLPRPIRDSELVYTAGTTRVYDIGRVR